MTFLIIKNFGPIKEVSLKLGKINIITGLQSSGKSCILKVACHCAWVEKRIQLTQKSQYFENETTFIDQMLDFYNIRGYIQENTYIEYETDYIKFHYDHLRKSFKMEWKDSQWNYTRAKVSYIPADRNLVASIPIWSSMPLDESMIEFMSNWDKARRFLKREENILNLGISYVYDSMSNSDTIQQENGISLKLKEGSSGIQSLLPMYVNLDYITKGQYNDNDVKVSYEQKEERRNLLSTIYAHHKKTDTENSPTIITLEGIDYNFSNEKEAIAFKALYNNFLGTHYSKIFLEEPENNLFPPTQCQFVKWLSECIKMHDDTLFIATHSPYILHEMIKSNQDELNVFFTHCIDKEKRIYSVRQLDNTELHEMYDNGVDLFFNFELYL